MRKGILLATLALFASGAALPLCGSQNFSFGEDIFVAKDEVQKNIVSFGGRITVEGRVKENIVAFGGSITLSGEVGDTVVGFGSNITIKSTAVIRGDIASIGGILNKEPGCVIEGDTVYVKGGRPSPNSLREEFLPSP